MLNEREREVIECLLHGWTQGEMPLYGGLCYQDVYDLMDKLGVDKSEAVQALDDFVQEAKLVQVRKPMKASEMCPGKQYRYKEFDVVFHEISGPGDFLSPIRELNRAIVSTVGETDPWKKWGIGLEEEVEEISQQQDNRP